MNSSLMDRMFGPEAHDFLRDPISTKGIAARHALLTQRRAKSERCCQHSMQASAILTVVTAAAPLVAWPVTGHIELLALVIPGYLTLIAMVPGMLSLLPWRLAELALGELQAVPAEDAVELLRLLERVPEGAALAARVAAEKRAFVYGELFALRIRSEKLAKQGWTLKG